MWTFWFAVASLLIFLGALYLITYLWEKINHLEQRITELEYDRAHDEEWELDDE